MRIYLRGDSSQKPAFGMMMVHEENDDDDSIYCRNYNEDVGVDKHLHIPVNHYLVLLNVNNSNDNG